MNNKKDNNIKDEVFFIEHYCLSNGEHIILHDYQKAFLKWLKQIRKNK